MVIYLFTGLIFAFFIAYYVHVNGVPLPEPFNESTFKLLMMYGMIVSAWPFILGIVLTKINS